MPRPALVALDLVAVTVLAVALYFPRYHRRDIFVAIIGINVGVLAVAVALSSSEVTAALGFGLFGVLSIIRLRSAELDQEEIAYYFAALTLGLLGGVEIDPAWLQPTLMATILVALFVGDHPRLFAGYRDQVMTLDTAYTDEQELTDRLESLLGARITRVKVKRVDLVNDTTVVDVRFRSPA